MTPVNLFLLTLATWRLAYLVAKEDAPFKMAKRLRERFPLGGLTTCQYCASVWAAGILYVLMLTPVVWIVYILAASGGAMLMYRYTGGDHV